MGGRGLISADPKFDQAHRWHPGERLNHLFEEQCDRLRDTGDHDALAVVTAERTWTYDDLDRRANQQARFLISQGVRPGDRIGLLFDDPIQAYAGMLAVLKVNAAYVPLDVAFPSERASFIVEDSRITMLLSLSHLTQRLDQIGTRVLNVDDFESEIDSQPGSRLTLDERNDPVDELVYIVYTSGSTGRPKGVAIEHPSICNFVRVASEVYGVERGDRMYQGMTIAFDFSIEEIWVAFMVGATLVPKPAGATLLGYELAEFIESNAITALCCVPTVLATLDRDLPSLRFLLVSGESCPRDLIVRWHRAGRRFLNVYGPTEATVSATWTVVDPEGPVTIGLPLPTYTVVILDTVDDRLLPPGEIGEIGVAGIGLARGYVNRDDLTSQAFIPDFLDITGNPSRRIYRTGDLGRTNDAGLIEYHGRRDTQVKVRGYRIELSEIESVFRDVTGVPQVAVATYPGTSGAIELVTYYTRRRNAPALNHDEVLQKLRAHLPSYMIPRYLEELQVMPLLPSDKVDRSRLPAFTGGLDLGRMQNHVKPATPVERTLATLLAQALGVDEVSVEGDFFYDLGASSLLLAHFCARVRHEPSVPNVSMRDVYMHRSVRALAAALPATVTIPEPVPTPAARFRASTFSYVLCGTLQVLSFLAYTLLVALVVNFGDVWLTKANSWPQLYVGALTLGALAFATACTVPILAKWLLIGRWKPGRIPIWSLGYFRFWLVRTLIQLNPLVLFAGTPLYSIYLRMLGARIGRGVLILSRTPPVCTDLISIGDHVVIRNDCHLSGYRAFAGMIEIGSVSLGRDSFVGERTVVEIDTSIGEGSELGHASCLNVGQQIPAGQSWHGSPAQPCNVSYRAPHSLPMSRLTAFVSGVSQLGTFILIALPLAVLAPAALSRLFPQSLSEFTGWGYYAGQLALSAGLLVGGLVGSLVLVLTVPRLLNLVLRPDRVYPLYGFRYAIQRTMERVSNSKLLTGLFGDSSYIVNYLQWLGYDLCEVEQTGSNFGIEIQHQNPFLVTLGSGTMVSDGLSLLNADFSPTSFRLSRTVVGANNYVGNDIAYPAGGRTGADCLLATKVMIPMEGEIREGVGLLGSPCFEIPRSVSQDHTFDHLKTEEELARGLRSKNRHNLVTVGLLLLMECVELFGILVLAEVASQLGGYLGPMVWAADAFVTLLFSLTYSIALERLALWLGPLPPQLCSIYQREFWRHERFWKLSGSPVAELFSGTPVKVLYWRLVGMKIGRRVFDDGCAITEPRLVSIGDDCTLNAGSCIQCHSLEEGVFKSQPTTVGAGSTLGISTLVHYGVTIGDDASLDADSFLMKGEEVERGGHWQGNPARTAARREGGS
ncbi:MAG TPA: Pls/PosA family non-ribosomal peptide synthetase [Candidatus Dormibacteraeota bacterium]|nr:Pls/PosA family non-ribosomal peptide synthetase [Candidatus Dormibacteraeota bacterium]